MNPADGSGNPGGTPPPPQDPSAGSTGSGMSAEQMQQALTAAYQTISNLTQQLSQLQAHLQQTELQHAVSSAAAASAQNPPQVPQHSTVTSLNIKPPKPDPYGGGNNVSLWLFRLLMFFGAAGITRDNDRLAMVGCLLKDAAAGWWQSLHTNNSLPGTWQEFCQALTSRFQSVTEDEDARAKVSRMKQAGGTVRAYVNKFNEQILRVVGMDMKTQVESFLDGLTDPECRKHVRRRLRERPPADQHLMAAMQLAEEWALDEMRDGGGAPSNRRQQQYRPPPAAQPRHQLAAASGNSNGASTSGHGQRDQRPPPPDACWHCGKVGHRKKECKVWLAQQRRNGNANAADGGSQGNA